MKTEFAYKLSQEKQSEVSFFTKKLNSFSLYQDEEWVSIIEPHKKTCSYLLYNSNNELIAFALIIENFKIAHIQFGPLSNSKEAILNSIQDIYTYYKKKRYGKLTVQLGIPSNNDSEFIEYNLYNNIPFKQGFNINNWTTLAIPLENEIIDIQRGFSKGHKSAIKKALKEELVASVLESEKEIEAFSNIYEEVYSNRNITNTFPNIIDTFKKINNYLTTNKKGYFIGVRTKEDLLIGGIVLCKEGNRMLYKYGAASIHHKKMSVLHIAIFKAIEIAKKEGFDYIDLGGYNFFVNDKDQIFFINRFKKGFTKNYLFYPKKMTFTLNWLNFIVVQVLKTVYLKLIRFKKIIRKD